MSRARNNRGAIKTEYRGVMYDSKSEANFARHLDARVRAGEIKGWEGQVRVALIVNGAKVCTMIPDFLVTHNNGKKEYIEVKGYQTPIYKLKFKLFHALFPEAWYTLVGAKQALAL